MLPYSMDALKMLKILDVSQTERTRLQDSIGALTNLEGLNLSQIKISMLPHSIDALKMVKQLNVSQTKIS